MDGSSSTPDLQSILSTLAQYADPVQKAEVENESTLKAESRRAAPLEQNQLSLPSHAIRVAQKDPHLRPQNQSTASPKPMIDPATITTWQEGLRCVTKIAAQNSQFATTIRRMMADQRKQELRWYSERQALKQKQAERAKSSAQAQAILQSLGGSNSTSIESKAAEKAVGSVEEDLELAAFDRKIYAAQEDMDVTMTIELKGLGVPFFGTDQSLIVSDEAERPPDVRPLEENPKWSPIVTEKQLMELRRRMIGHFEDLYRD